MSAALSSAARSQFAQPSEYKNGASLATPGACGMKLTCLPMLFALATLIMPLSAALGQKVKPSQLRIALIGDSTVASYANPPADRPDLTGWGQVLGELFEDHV